MVWGAPGAQAADPTDLNTPSGHTAYVAELAAESQARKAEAILWARKSGMAIRCEDTARVTELMALWDSRPVYYVTENVNAAASLLTDRVRDIAPWNLDGDGLAVGLWDGSGVRATHREFAGPDGRSRVKIRDSYSTSAHATHVAGTIGAAGIDPLAKGMAPRVRIESYNWNDDTAQMSVLAARTPGEPGKIYVSNHSYGVVAGWYYIAGDGLTGHTGWHWLGTWAGADSWEDWFGQYGSIAREWDAVAYYHPYYLAFAAAGNDRNDTPAVGETVYYWLGSGWHSITYDPDTCAPGDGDAEGGYDTVSGAAVAKNIMTVGAIADAISEDTRSLSHAAMTKFSSWGPTDDGRIKPDIVANGIQVYSADHDFDNDYLIADGTSMASPSACGSAILLVQHYGRLFPGDAMRSSTLKGLIIHTADDLGRAGPDYEYGWGLMNTKAAVELITRSHSDPLGPTILEDLLGDGNTTDSYYLHCHGNKPIRVTLCWTDPRIGWTTKHDDRTPRIVHDLDLRLVGPDGTTVYLPYVLDPDDPSAPASTGDNTLDNVEQVYVAMPSAPGVYEVRISHKRYLLEEEQYYSLISNTSLSDRRPPRAQDASLLVAAGTPMTATLTATDDGWPESPGGLTYIVTSLPEHGTLMYLDGTPMTTPTALADFANQVVYRSDINFLGTDRFTFCADDGGAAPWGGVSDAAAVTLSVQNLVTIECQVNTGEDDAYALTSGGYQKNSSKQLLVGQYGSAMRFNGVDLPAGSRIASARLKICVDEASHAHGVLEAEAAGDAIGFATGHPRIYDRPRTATSVAWDCAGVGSAYNWQDSPDISSIVQEVVDRSDWSAGNSLVIMLSPVALELPGLRFAAFEESAGYAARLEIAYTPGSDDGPVSPFPPGQFAPVAQTSELFTASNTPVTVTLAATDDGLPGALTYTVASLPEHGSLSSQGVPINQPVTLTGSAGHVVYTPDADFTGDDSFTFYADDGGNAPSGGTSNTATVTIKVRDLVTRQFQVVAAGDDAHAIQNDQFVSDTMLAVGQSSSAMRFRNVDVPQGSEIAGARLLLCMGTSLVEHRIEAVVEAEAVGHAGGFTGDDRHIVDLPRTEAVVPWVWEAGDTWPHETYCPSPDIAAVIQEIVDRPDWQRGNAIAILYSGVAYHGQDLEFFACDDAYADRAAKLEITYAPNPNAEPISAPVPEGSLPVAEDMQIKVPVNSPVTIVLKATDDGLPNPPGKLTYAVTSLPAHGTLRYPGGEQITQPAALANFDNRVVYMPDADFIGEDAFTFYADDRGSGLSAGTSDTQTVTLYVMDATLAEFQVSAAQDDASALPSEASNRLHETALRVGRFSSGMRFRSIDIPQGTEIVSARLKICMSATHLTHHVDGAIQAEASGNAPDFAGAERHLCNLAGTQASVPWTWESGEYEGWFSSPDISEVVQEIIDRPGWFPGNSIAILYTANSDTDQDLEFHAYDGNPDYAAKLEIIYARPTEPISHWQFDEGQGNTAHDWVGNRHGTVHGAQWTSGQVADALEFDGVDDYVELPPNGTFWLPRHDFALAFWAFFNTGDGASPIGQEMILDLDCGKNTSAIENNAEDLGYGVRRRWADGGITFQMTTIEFPDEDLDSRTQFPAGQWYHIVAVRHGPSQEIYVNGQLDIRRTCSSTPIDFSGAYSDSNVSIGRYTMTKPKYARAPDAYFNGKLDEVMIFDRALSPRQVQHIYQETIAGPGEGSPPTAEDVEVEIPLDTPVTITLVGTDDGLPDPPGTLAYVLALLPPHGALEYPDGTPINQPAALRSFGNEVVYRPDAGFEGQDSFTFYTDDGGTAPSGGTSEMATVTITVRPAPEPVTCEYQVTMSLDDAHAAPAGAFNYIADDLLMMGLHSTGMRFTNVNIPEGSTIVSAHLKICRSTRRIRDRIDGIVHAEATGDAGNFAGNDRHICKLTKTYASVPWIWEVEDHEIASDYTGHKVWWGAWRTSSDLSEVVQEIVDRPDWSKGNAIALIYASNTPHEGEDLAFFSRDHHKYPERAAKLEITYVPR